MYCLIEIFLIFSSVMQLNCGIELSVQTSFWNSRRLENKMSRDELLVLVL